MRSVAIVGFAPETRELVAGSLADEVWVLNHAALELSLPKISRVFEIHTPEHFAALGGSEAYVDWLTQPHPFPIYMQTAYAGVPSAIEYPLEAVKSLFEKLFHNGQSAAYLTSTVALMMALALVEGFGRIELYGVEMASDGEYVYQRDGVTLLIGMALSRGVEVHIPEGSQLCKANIYAFEGGQMINRQALESRKTALSQELDKWLGLANRAAARCEQGATDEALKENEDAKAMVFAHDGALQLVEQLIAECDLQESRQPLVNRITNAV